MNKVHDVISNHIPFLNPLRIPDSDSESKMMNVMKGLGIIAVVLGHSGFPAALFFYLFHMQLFFFVSGYFFKDRYVDRPVQLIWRRIKSLCLPILIAECGFLLFRSIAFRTEIDLLSVTKILTLNNNDPFLYVLWFLVVLLFVNVWFVSISWIVKRFFKTSEKIRALLIFMISVAGFSMIITGINFFAILNPELNPIKNVPLYFLDTRVLLCLPIFYLGYLYKKFGNKIPIRRDLAIGSFVILTLSYFSGTIDIFHNIITTPTYFIANSLVGIYMCVYLSKIISSRQIEKTMAYIGKQSLYIMILHVAAFHIVVYLVSKLIGISMQVPWWLWIVHTIFGLSLPLLFAYAMEKFIHLYKNTRSRFSTL